jgi:hypothetical protein
MTNFVAVMVVGENVPELSMLLTMIDIPALNESHLLLLASALAATMEG